MRRFDASPRRATPKGHYPFIICTAPHQRNLLQQLPSTFVAHLNAHINYDLAYGTYLTLKQHGDEANHLLLPRRKFDHDQVNNILANSIPQVAETLTRDYGGGILFLRNTLHGLDIVLSSSGLKYYRERVWWSAISYLSTTDDEEVKLVHHKLNWESAQLAKRIADTSLWTLPVRTVGRAIRKEHMGDIPLETPATQ